MKGIVTLSQIQAYGEHGHPNYCKIHRFKMLKKNSLVYCHKDYLISSILTWDNNSLNIISRLLSPKLLLITRSWILPKHMTLEYLILLDTICSRFCPHFTLLAFKIDNRRHLEGSLQQTLHKWISFVQGDFNRSTLFPSHSQSRPFISSANQRIVDLDLFLAHIFSIQ